MTRRLQAYTLDVHAGKIFNEIPEKQVEQHMRRMVVCDQFQFIPRMQG
jgi:hypothetical protein